MQPVKQEARPVRPLTEAPDLDWRVAGSPGSVPGASAVGRGPAPDGGFSRQEYDHPAAGWGAARSVGQPATKHIIVEITASRTAQ